MSRYGAEPLDDFAQVVTCGLHADPADQTADMLDGRFAFVAAHGAITLFDVLPDDAFGDIVGAIELLRPSAPPSLESCQA